MSSETIEPGPSITGTILRVLVSFPVACFTCALATDIAYVQSANIMWANFSAWLLAAGLGIGVLAAIAALVDFLVHRRGRASRSAWPLVIGALAVLVIALFDNLVHSRDGWTAVVPEGVILSAILVVVTFLTLWLGSARASRAAPVMQYSGARR